MAVKRDHMYQKMCPEIIATLITSAFDSGSLLFLSSSLSVCLCWFSASQIMGCCRYITLISWD